MKAKLVATGMVRMTPLTIEVTVGHVSVIGRAITCVINKALPAKTGNF